MLGGVVSHFLARSVKRKCYSAEQEDSFRPSFKAIDYSRSWMKNRVNIPAYVMVTPAMARGGKADDRNQTLPVTTDPVH